MEVVLGVAELSLGLALICLALASAFRTVVLPRAAFDPLSRGIFLGLRSILLWISRRSSRVFETETVLAVHAPLGLLLLALAWALGIMSGFTLLFHATADMSLERAFVLAGSSFTTLGFERAASFSHEVLSIAAAILGLGIVALLIGYLPTIYGLFSHREVIVADVAIKSGGVAHGPALVARLMRDGDPARLDALWLDWEHWLIALGETHTAEPSLNFFRSPRASRSWLTSATAVLDASILRNVVVDAPYSARADMVYQAGTEAIVSIAHFFFMRPGDDSEALSTVSRAEFDEAVRSMEGSGVPITRDREAAWTSFVTLRSAYERQLVGLERLVLPPASAWSGGID